VRLSERLDPGPPFEWAGRFRRLDLPEDVPPLPGILTIDREEGISLRLFGSFPDIPRFAQWNPTFSDWTLVGYVESGDAVTVLDARHYGGRADSPPGTLEIHLRRAAAVLVGDQQILDPVNDTFDQIEIAYDELRAWIGGPRGLPPYGWQNVRMVRGSGAAEMPGDVPPWLVGYYDRPPLEATVPSLGQVKLKLQGVTRPVVHGAQLAEEGGLLIELDEPVTRDGVDEVHVPFTRLLELAFDREVRHRHLRMRRSDTTALDRAGNAADRWLYVLTGREAPRPDPKVQWPLAIYATPNNFESLLRSWLEIHREQRRALNYFFATAYEHDRYVDRGLLTAVQAIEGYHRTDVAVPEADVLAFKEQLKEAGAMVKDRGLDPRVIAAPHAVEPGLDARVTDLLNRQQADTEGSSSDNRARNKFASDIAYLRNGLAHVLERLDSFEPGELYDHRRALLVLMKLELLRRLGATLEERVAIVDNMRWETPGGLSAFGSSNP
jgi:hypothetical protein